MNVVHQRKHVEAKQPLLVFSYSGGVAKAHLPHGFEMTATSCLAQKTYEHILKLEEGGSCDLSGVVHSFVLSLPTLFMREMLGNTANLATLWVFKQMVAVMTKYPDAYILPDTWIMHGGLFRSDKVMQEMVGRDVSVLFQHYLLRCDENRGLATQLITFVYHWFNMHINAIGYEARQLLQLVYPLLHPKKHVSFSTVYLAHTKSPLLRQHLGLRC